MPKASVIGPLVVHILFKTTIWLSPRVLQDVSMAAPPFNLEIQNNNLSKPVYGVKIEKSIISHLAT